MARPISRGVLSFGLVSIPVELYSAIEDHNIRFHLLHKKCGSRVRNQLFCPVCKVVIERDETVRGYEVSKGQYVRVEDAELEALEAEANSSIEMREFIPIEKVDPIYFESSYYLAPDKGADKPYRLLADTMAKTGRVALAQTVFHNKEALVLIRSVKRGLILHFLFFKDEIRDFDAIAKGEDIKLPSEQLELGRGLIEKMSSADFEPEGYADEYRERARAMIEKKVEGQAKRSRQRRAVKKKRKTQNRLLFTLRRHFFRWWPNAILVAKPILLLLHRKVDSPLDERKHDLINTSFLGWVVDLESAQ